MKIVIKGIMFGFVILLSTACTTIKTNELSVEESNALKDKTLVYSKYKELPDFSAQTGLNVQFGLLGLAAAISSGNDMIRNSQIIDPAIDISRKLAELMTINHNVKVVENTDVLAQTNDLSELLDLYRGYDYILDVKTLDWNSIYYVSDWNSYIITYIAHARLIDTQKKEVIVEVLCNSSPEYEDTNQGPSYEDLENGVGLKKELNRSVEYCVDHIKTVAKLQYQKDKSNPNVVTAKLVD